MPLTPSSSIVILTGAGISAESGIPTFRASDGLWENHPVEAVATPEGFARNPDLVHRFYNERRRKLASVVPNAAHFALAELEAAWPGEVLVVTQNVDDLHDRAGSKNLLHMHGELLRARCAACETVVVHTEDLDQSTACTTCGTVGRMRPHIVWFGEMPIGLPRIYKAVSRCGLFVAIGTSGNVYPASSLVDVAPPGAKTLEINLQPSAVASAFREHRTGPATVEVPAWVRSLTRTLST